MQHYFNRADREHHIVVMVFHLVASEWLATTKSITAEERKCFKTALTWLKKGSESMLNRAVPEYLRAVRNQAANSYMFLEDNSGRALEKQVETTTLDTDDMYDFADLAVRECRKCKEADFKNCKRYGLFMRIGVPPLTEDTEDCPYR